VKTKLIHLLVVSAMLLALVAVVLPGVAAAATPPVANAGPDQVYVTTGGGSVAVQLDASASYDPLGESLSYVWSVQSTTPPGLPAVTFLPNPEAEQPTFTALHGVYVLQVAVTNTDGATSFALVTIVNGGATWYVSQDPQNAADLPSHGSAAKPWRTITYAVTSPKVVDGDTIMVAPSSFAYGGTGAAAENIIVDKCITIESQGDYTNTFIDVQNQLPNPPSAVVTIVHPSLPLNVNRNFGVVLRGFTLTGAFFGVNAVGCDLVQILNCHIKVKCEGVGIGVYSSKGPLVDSNWVEVGNACACYGYGIIMQSCLAAQVTNNTVTVTTGTDNIGCPGHYAVGIWNDWSPKSLIQNNIVTVTMGGDATGIGIAVDFSDFTKVVNNTVNVNITGDTFAEAYGIEVQGTPYAEVTDNTVVVGTMVRQDVGWTFAVGIDVWTSDFNKVQNNSVTVSGAGSLSAVMSLPFPASVQSALGDLATALGQANVERVKDLGNVTAELLGTDPSAFGGAQAEGITVGLSQNPKITGNNPVNVAASIVGGASGSAPAASIVGAAMSMGITAFYCCGAQVQNNDVASNASGNLKADTENWWVATSYGLGSSIGLGITLLGCPPFERSVPVSQETPSEVAGNSVNASGDLVLAANAADVVVAMEAQNPNATIPAIQSVVEAAYQVAEQTLQSEPVGRTVVGEPQSLLAYSEADGAGIGIGIITIACPEVQITENTPVGGDANVVLTSYALEGVVQDWTQAWGGALALGAGIVSKWCPETAIDKNGVSAGATGSGDVGAVEYPMTLEYVNEVSGGVASAALGIIVIGGPKADVSYNTVTVSGDSLVTVEAFELLKNKDANAYGSAIGVGLGIAILWSDGFVVNHNTVNAYGNGDVTSTALVIAQSDPIASAIGGALGAGVGIIAKDSDHGTIMNNTVDAAAPNYGAVGTAKSFVYAYEWWDPILNQGVMGLSGALGIGLGIVVDDCRDTDVSSVDNQPATVADVQTQTVTARGLATVYSLATTAVPLAPAFSGSMGAGVGIAFVVFDSNDTNVGPCNVADGGGAICVSSDVYGDPCQVDMGVALGLDMLFLGSQDSTANYNDLIGVNWSYACGPSLVIDWGLLNIGFCRDFHARAEVAPTWDNDYRLDARYNWWADATGPSWPSGMPQDSYGWVSYPPGNGQALVWCPTYCAAVEFQPWLYVSHMNCIYDHIGRFGFAIPVHTCWNTFSTPIKLAATENTIDTLLAFSGLTTKVTIAYYFDRSGTGPGTWTQIQTGYQIKPLDAMYIKMNASGNFLLLADDVETGMMPPTKQLSQGWNLIGTCPPFFDSGMYVQDAVSSVYGLPGAGYAFVLSPPVGSTQQGRLAQESWVWSGPPTNPENCPCMLSGFGYWVWMNSSMTLAGFGFTPVNTLYPENNSPCRIR